MGIFSSFRSLENLSYNWHQTREDEHVISIQVPAQNLSPAGHPPTQTTPALLLPDFFMKEVIACTTKQSGCMKHLCSTHTEWLRRGSAVTDTGANKDKKFYP